jgi:peptidoglycan/xylan/chitin deacetylase (PgdA/CDA1 family)
VRVTLDHPTELRIPVSFARPIGLDSGRAIAEGFVRPTIALPELAEQFFELTGVKPEAFQLPTRVFEFQARDSDEVVVKDADRGIPLISRRDDQLIISFDIPATEAFRFTDSKRPIYTYLPWFNIQRLPERVRRPVSNVVQALRSRNHADIGKRYQTLPLTNLEMVLLLIQTIASQGRDGWSSPFRWPEGKRAAFVSLHDIDTDRFLRQKEQSALFRLEQKHQINATWFVPTYLLNRSPRALDFLLKSGNEVGWHGHKHDHRDHVGRYAQQAANALKGSWLNSQSDYPTGMRAPKLLKSEYLFTVLQRSCLKLRYDTSFCNGIVPYHLWLHGKRSRLLEIPTTVPTDIRLYNELASVPRKNRARLMVNAQLTRTSKLIEAGGLVSIVTHPEQCLSERPDFLEVYDEYLSYIKNRRDIWFTTAGELFEHWTKDERVDAGEAGALRPLGAKAS